MSKLETGQNFFYYDSHTFQHKLAHVFQIQPQLQNWGIIHKRHFITGLDNEILKYKFEPIFEAPQLKKALIFTSLTLQRQYKLNMDNLRIEEMTLDVNPLNYSIDMFATYSMTKIWLTVNIIATDDVILYFRLANMNVVEWIINFIQQLYQYMKINKKNRKNDSTAELLRALWLFKELINKETRKRHLILL